MQLLNHVARTMDRLQTEVGHTGKRRHYSTGAAMVLKHLFDSGLTIDFKADSPEERALGCQSIWQKIAFNMGLDAEGRIIDRPSMIQRCRSASLHWSSVRSSIKYCREQLIRDWQIPLLIVPRWAGQKQIQVITCFGDYQVNEGETASQIALQCGDRRLRSNIRKCMEHYELTTGGRVEISKKIAEIVLQECEQCLPQPMLKFTDEIPIG